MKTNTATNVSELPALFGGQPTGTEYKIEGYVDSSGVTKNLRVKTLGAEDYTRMKRESLKILEETPAPSLEGYPAAAVAAARDALMASYRDAGQSGEFKDPYTAAPEGGYSNKEGDAAVYLLRLESLDAPAAITDLRTDLPRTKSALTRALRLPAGRYLHTLKFSDGKFKSVTRL